MYIYASGPVLTHPLAGIGDGKNQLIIIIIIIIMIIIIIIIIILSFDIALFPY